MIAHPPAVRASALDSKRFTIDGGELLERRIAEICSEVRERIFECVPRGKIGGLLLAGGYGRGEGGVLQTPEGESPYNDLDFYVFLNGNHLLNEKRFGPILHHAAEELSASAEVEIELKIDSLARWPQLPVTMFSHDVVAGHKWLHGEESLLAGSEYHRDAKAIPLSEAARLLLNRCSGLLFAAEQLLRPEFDSANADFVARNIAKAQLAFGDAVLVAFAQYHWSCLERSRRLKSLGLAEPWFAEIVSHHAAGVEWKLHPSITEPDREALRKLHSEVTEFAWKIWQWLEQRRLGYPFNSPTDYSTWPIDKCPETNPLRNLLVNLRSFRAG